MTKGYLIFAQNNDDNYLKMAYVLALSIKLTQNQVHNVSLVTDSLDSIPDKFNLVFDNIIPITEDLSVDTEWKIENRSKLYHLTPYDETVILDADMLFLSDVSSWWDYLSKNHNNMCFVTKSITYRNEPTDDLYYRQAFVDNKLPNLYSAFFYFKKTDLNLAFWNTVENIVKDWKVFYSRFLPNSTPKVLSMDVTFALAAKIHGIEDEIISTFDYPTFVHMKPFAQRWKNTNDKWSNLVGTYMNKRGQLKIGNYQQFGIFHYTEKEFLTDEIFNIFESLYKEKLDG
jgi:hypothetical protein